MPTDSTDWLTQTDRLLVFSAPAATDVIVVEQISGTEAISQPFEYKVTLLSQNDSVDLKSLLRTQGIVSVVLADGSTRYINGLFSSLLQGGLQDDQISLYEGILVPAIWFLSLKADCRVYQNQSVPDIVRSVLSDAGISDYEMNLQGTYSPRDYCVQYRETTLNFISRLLEEEGIFYYFKHTSTTHTVVFADKSSSLTACVQATVNYSDSGNQRGWAADDEIASLARTEQVCSDKTTLTDYYFETPSASLQVNDTTPNASPVAEVYDYPGLYTTVTAGQQYSRVRMEEKEVDLFVIEGSGRVRAFTPGFTFNLLNHFRKDTNQDYLLTEVSVDAFDKTYRLGRTAGDAFSFVMTFGAIPKSTAYRPPRRALKPVVYGSQTALVVGKAGEEIWVDSFGRVKVQFYWDRIGSKDEKSSCWVRVSQVWAGKNWGWVTLPRIGQEVIVDFLEGNPDQPIITGRVYNAEQMPPYTLPDNQTQSGIKTRSSKSGTTDNFNEIRFEDNKGSELLSIHAEKDMDTFVENNDTQTIECNRTIKVDGTHTETITKDTTVTVTEGNHSLTLNQGNQSITLDTGNQSVTLSIGNQTTSVKLGSISTEAMQSIKLTVGPSSIMIEPTGITISAPMVTVSAEANCSVDGGLLLGLTGVLTTIN